MRECRINILLRCLIIHTGMRVYFTDDERRPYIDITLLHSSNIANDMFIVFRARASKW